MRGEIGKINPQRQPFAEENDSFAAENDSFAAANVPFATANDSFAAANVPFAAENDSFATANVPFATENVPFAAANVPFAAANDSFAAANDSFAAENDSFAAENDSFAAENDSFAAENDSFAAENDSFATADDSFATADALSATADGITAVSALFAIIYIILKPIIKYTMNKQINFEDIIYILNVRMRMLKDLFHLDIEPDLFYNQTIEDMEFINSTLGTLAEKFLGNPKFIDSETDAENLLDAEWNFSQLLNEISNNAGKKSFINFPETQTWTAKFKNESTDRRKQIEAASMKAENFISEPGVTYTELSGLLGSV